MEKKYTFSEILASRKKSENPWFSIYYSLSSLIVAIALRLKLTPNQITFIAFLLNFSSISFYLLDILSFKINLLLLYIGLNIAHVFDCADGHLATLTGRRSRAGEWLDHSFDTFKLLFVGIALLHTINILHSKISEVELLDELSRIIIISGVLLNYMLLRLSLEFTKHIDPYSISLLERQDIGTLTKMRKVFSSWMGEYGNYLLFFPLFAVAPSLATRLVIIYCAYFFLISFCRILKTFIELRASAAKEKLQKR